MEKYFLYIKYKLPYVWLLIEQVNSLFFFVFASKITTNLISSCVKHSNSINKFKLIELKDLKALSILLNGLESTQKKYFEVHHYSIPCLRLQLKNRSFIMVGCFRNSELVGYFFLRCFFNKKCFVGRLVHRDFRGKGIGRTMNAILYRAAWQSGFRVFATLSSNNRLVMQSHKNNPYMSVIKELPDNYLLVEFKKPEDFFRSTAHKEATTNHQ